MPDRLSRRFNERRQQPPASVLFARQRTGIYRLLGLMVASAVLMVVDQNTPWLVGVRSAVGTVLDPVEYVARSPYVIGRHVGGAFADRNALRARVAALEQENRQLQGAVLRFDAIAQDLDQLRALFNSQLPLKHEALIAELIGLSEQPKEVILDKGFRHGVNVGQPVIDAAGLFGQIVETSASRSRVLLVTDPSHAVPVYVYRNDLRAIAVGDGLGGLTLKYAAATLDVRVGDVLYSSGLGGRFPFGYPVGIVTAASQDAAEPFLRTTVRPSATLDRSRHLLVLTSAPKEDADADIAVGQALAERPPGENGP